MPFMLFAFALYLPGAVVLYYAASSFIAIIQQHFALKQDEEEMTEIADEEKPTERKGKNGTVVRIKKAQNAKIISKKKIKKRSRGGRR
jgi:membrane protein insertase Oxa1/YidC/SpoIIIJ